MCHVHVPRERGQGRVPQRREPPRRRVPAPRRGSPHACAHHHQRRCAGAHTDAREPHRRRCPGGRICSRARGRRLAGARARAVPPLPGVWREPNPGVVVHSQAAGRCRRCSQWHAARRPLRHRWRAVGRAEVHREPPRPRAGRQHAATAVAAERATRTGGHDHGHSSGAEGSGQHVHESAACEVHASKCRRHEPRFCLLRCGPTGSGGLLQRAGCLYWHACCGSYHYVAAKPRVRQGAANAVLQPGAGC